MLESYLLMATKKTTKNKSTEGEFAVIETGGKQYKVMVGDVFKVEKLGDEMKEGEKISFDKVLLVDDGSGATTIGDPYIKGAKVEAKFVKNGKGKKVIVIKYKQKSRYFKKRGHRQPFSEIEITSIK